MFEIATLLYFYYIAAAQIAAAQECVVGEAVTNPGRSLCSSGNVWQCIIFCITKLGGMDYQGARCSEPRGPSGTRECLCTAKCARAGCWGEPYCNTFDQVYFPYHGLCKHVLVKPIRPLQSVPNFEVRLKNKPHRFSTTTAVIDMVEVIIPQWDATIEIQNGILKVNGQVANTPYRMEGYQDGYKLIGFNVTKPTQPFVVGGSSSTLIVQTSFGLVVKSETRNVYVYLPRMRELRGNLVGLLGKWDDDASNDFIDADSIKRDPNNAVDATLFGNSWCLVKTRSTIQSMQRILEDVEARKSDLNKCRGDSKRKRAMAICQQLREPKFANCAKQSRAAEQTVTECESNVCSAGENADEQMAAANNFLHALTEVCAVRSA